MREEDWQEGGAPPGDLAPPADAGELFMQGPPMLAQARLGLLRPGRLHTVRRCVLFVFLTWAPLALLTALEGTLMPRSGGVGFLADLGAFARSWIAGPLLLAADVMAGRELSRIADRFGWSCAQAPAARSGFRQVVASTVRLRDGPLLELAVAATVLLLVAAILTSLPLDQMPAWHRSAADPHRLSAAGWWYGLVSLPLLLVLVVGWLWRLLLWTRFLWLISRLELSVVPEHPDRAGGLGFMGYSVRGFTFVAAAFGSVVAGAVANQVVNGHVPLADFRFLIAGTAATCVVLFCAPLCVFGKRLADERRAGLREFGKLATSFGLEFRREWFGGRVVGRDVLDHGDFSAAADLYQVVDRVQAMRFVPLDRFNIAQIAAASLLPFAPVALLAVPVDTIVNILMGVLV